MRTLDLKMKLAAAIASMVALFIIVGCLTGKTAQSSPAKNIADGVEPGPNDARIAYVTARLMEEVQYSEQQFDRSVSENFSTAILRLSTRAAKIFCNRTLTGSHVTARIWTSIPSADATRRPFAGV